MREGASLHHRFLKTAPSDDAKLPAADGGVKRKGEVVKSSSTDVSQKNTPAAEDSSKGPSKKEGSAGKNEKPSENPDAAKKQDDISDVKVTITEATKVTRSTFPEWELREGRTIIDKTIIDKKEEYHGKELL